VVDVAKTVSLPNTVYNELVYVSKELAAVAGKPISLSMAVYLLMAVYRAHLSEPCARDAFRQRLASSDIISPEEFEKALDEPQVNPASKRKPKKE
jgi:hypothetical protein